MRGSKRDLKKRVKAVSAYARKTGGKEPRSTLLIICEGGTEKNYFINLKDKLKLTPLEVEIIDQGAAALTIVKKAIERIDSRKNDSLRANYDEVWCIIDVEIPVQPSMKKAIALARKEKIKIALTNPCFEYWFILHFKETTKRFNNNKQVLAHLREHYYDGYSKNEEIIKEFCKRIYEIRDDAIENAKRCCRAGNWGNDLTKHNPSTDVYKVVEKLIAISKM